MGARTATPVVAVFALAGCLTDFSTKDDSLHALTKLEDHSGFSSFVFSQSGAEGFCPDVALPHRVELSRDSTGAYELSAVVFLEGPAGSVGCVAPGSQEGTCAMDSTVARRSLTSSEAERVAKVFERVVLTPGGNDSWCLGYDPCRVIHCRWDSSAYSNFACQDYSLDANTVDEVGRLMVGLLAGEYAARRPTDDWTRVLTAARPTP
jgi:hypothetical protein